MNSKGFTLVELLGVIIIIAIISILIIPSVENVIKKSNDTVYNNQINTILKASYDCTLKNISLLPDEGEINYLTLGELKILGLIDSNIKNPKTNKNFPDNLVISINNVGADYIYDKNTSILKGNYLYKVELEKLDSNINDPTITLNIIEQNSNGDYILTLNLNESIDITDYSAISKEGIDLTNRVKYYITKSDILFDTIDTTTSSIYKVNYFVVDDNGYSKLVVLNIIIADTEQPVITLPTNNTIDVDINNYDLLTGVICKDNSGFCDVTAIKEEELGNNKYKILYTAKDPSGNTSTVRRIINVEK